MNYFYFYMAKILAAVLPLPKKEIWLIGENLGKCARDNGYYFFKYVSDQKKEVDAYFVAARNCMDKVTLRTYQNKVVTANSLRHYLIYFQCRYCIVSHGIKDSMPIACFHKEKRRYKPIIYLQHGVIKYKKMHYGPLSYSKSLLRFFASSEEEKKIITEKMAPSWVVRSYNLNEWKIKSHLLTVDNIRNSPSAQDEDVKLLRCISQTGYLESLREENEFYGRLIGLPKARVPVTGLPRYDSLLKEAKLKNHENNTVLIFPTWREALAGLDKEEFEVSDFFKNYSDFLKGDQLADLIKKFDLTVKFCLHIENRKFLDSFSPFLANGVELVGNEVNIRNLVLSSDILVTDYSSLAWEFLVLGKPTIFYHFDYPDYAANRGTYADCPEDWHGAVAYNSNDLVGALESNLSRKFQDDEQDAHGLVTENCSEKVFSEIRAIPKKVYFLVYNIFGFGGTVKTVTNTANYLYEKGYDVEIISLRRTHKRPRMGLHPGIKIFELYDARRMFYKIRSGQPLKKKLFFSAMRVLRKFPSRVFSRGEDLHHMVNFAVDVQLYRKIKSLRDCTLISTLPSLNVFSAMHAHASVKSIGQEHKFFEAHDHDIKSSILKSYRRLDALTVLTEDDKKQYERQIPGLKVIVQPNGSQIIDRKKDFPEISDGGKIVFLGRLVEQKGVDLLIKAFSAVAADFPDWSVDIYGDGVLKSDSDRLIKSLNLQGQISINSPVSDIDSVLENADFMALPSVFEPFGMVIIEAFSHSVPVVCFDIEYGPRSLVEDGRNGLKAPAFDIEVYAEKLVALMCDKKTRLQLGKNGREDFESKYTITAVGEKFERLLG
ncbi:hypothetical protein CEK62_06955 [Alcanivorax sp. N3-2A]|nr:hypothetical protein CEK62_06955 [Alcanivorax sp. N3-2A]|tara:strand:+ start:10577 stop:13060 length:2484 start_codon:yes stop_codon:yes gene_type:complete